MRLLPTNCSGGRPVLSPGGVPGQRSIICAGGGMGSGRGGGVGPGSGPGFGPGSGGGMGGGAYRIGGGVSPPSIIYKVEPEYSEEARKAKFQGTWCCLSWWMSTAIRRN